MAADGAPRHTRPERVSGESRPSRCVASPSACGSALRPMSEVQTYSEYQAHGGRAEKTYTNLNPGRLPRMRKGAVRGAGAVACVRRFRPNMEALNAHPPRPFAFVSHE
jgi:hypothetical protein